MTQSSIHLIPNRVDDEKIRLHCVDELKKCDEVREGLGAI